MKAHRKYLAFAAVLLAAAPAAAQSEGDEGRAQEGYPTHPGERHLIGRLVGGTGVRLNDAFGAGALAPVYFHGTGGYLLFNSGSIRMGPSVGVQVGLDLGRGPPQYTLQPGWFALMRRSEAFALTARLDVPLLITRGPSEYAVVNTGMTDPPIQVALTRTYTVGFGVELGVGAAYYLTSGVAVTGELAASIYFGDSFFTYPVIGAGLGVLVDYEMLP